MTSSSHIYINTFISSPLLTFAILYSLNKVMGLRFLNFESFVHNNIRVPMIDNVKKALDALSQAMTLRELGPITQQYFNDEFGVPLSAVELVFVEDRKSIESFIALQDSSIQHQQVDTSLDKYDVLVNDEIAFTHFYEASDQTKRLLSFMDYLDVDVFIPIIDHGAVIAYITLKHNARSNDFFSRTEQDQMVVFANYIGNIIRLLHSTNVESVLQENKQLQQEMYSKHQQINQYKESLRFFLKDTAQRKIGLVLYKNRQFNLLNPQATELIGINLNQDAGHPLSLEMKAMIQRLESYSSAQTSMVNMPQGTKLVLHANFYGQKTSIIFTITMPEIADLIKPQMDNLSDPSEWDYLLYLQTTASGQLISQLLPGQTKYVMNAKIELLKMALSTKALLIDAADKDVLAVVEIIHHINLAKELVVIDLMQSTEARQQATLLFGLVHENTVGVLERLAESGTLFIKNIHLLALHHQDTLAHFIQYGFYATLHSDKKNRSAVRIVCSSTADLNVLVQQGTFSLALFKQLRAMNIPCLLTLPKEELIGLIEGYSAQAISSSFLLNAVRLSEHEQTKLIANSPSSIQEFKEKIKNILRNKTNKNNMADDIVFDRSYQVADPLLAQAVRLGKTSLKDERIMRFLWNKFNNQNKIASLLGVNRSSVNRRCKEFGLE